MKCSVCAQEIPEESYSEHLAAEHGVTDDPSAVLFEHLTGDRLDDAPDDDVEGEAEEDGEFEHADDVDGGEKEKEDREDEDREDEGDLDEEPAIQDPFERMLAEHPTTDPRELAAWRAAREGEDEGTAADADGGGAAEGHEQPEEDVDPLDALVAAFPNWDVRGGAADVGTVILPDRRERKRGLFRRRRPAPAAVRGDAAPGSAQEPDRDEEPEHEAQPAREPLAAPTAAAVATPDHGEDDEPTVVAPVATAVAEPGGDVEEAAVVPPKPANWQRDRRVATAGLVAVVILIAAAVTYLLTRDSDTTKTAATSSSTAGTVATTVAPTFLPGAPGGDTTTAVPATQVPVATTTPVVTTAPVATTTPAPVPNPASRIAFVYSDAQCASGQLAVRGAATNNNPATYSFQFVVHILNSAGTEVGRANGSISHLAAHNSASFVATGTCSDISGSHPTQEITSITPG